MVIEAVMTRDVVTVSPDQTLAEVRELFSSHEFHHLLVMEKGRVMGVLTDRDLLKNLSPFLGTRVERSQDEWLLHRKVHQVMSRRLVSVPPGTPIKHAVVKLLEEGVTCLPVIDEKGVLQGLVTWHDLLRYMLDCTVVASPTCSINGWVPKKSEAA